MAALVSLRGCCGVWEIDGVSDALPAKVLFDIQEIWGVSSRNLVFTDITQYRKCKHSGWGFAAFLRKKRLGAVLGPSKPGLNPESNNRVCVWVWTPNVEAVERWARAENRRQDRNCA